MLSISTHLNSWLVYLCTCKCGEEARLFLGCSLYRFSTLRLGGHLIERVSTTYHVGSRIIAPVEQSSCFIELALLVQTSSCNISRTEILKSWPWYCRARMDLWGRDPEVLRCVPEGSGFSHLCKAPSLAHSMWILLRLCCCECCTRYAQLVWIQQWILVAFFWHRITSCQIIPLAIE